jgi:hypothetical protein
MKMRRKTMRRKTMRRKTMRRRKMRNKMMRKTTNTPATLMKAIKNARDEVLHVDVHVKKNQAMKT